MGLLLLAAIAALVALYLTAPRRHTAHASRVKPLFGPIGDRFVQTGPIYDLSGKPVSLAGKELFVANGDSMTDNKIESGSTCVGERLTPEGRAALKVGDIVIVDAPTEKSQTGLRLRKILAFLPNGEVTFQNHRPRPLDQIRARITHVVC